MWLNTLLAPSIHGIPLLPVFNSQQFPQDLAAYWKFNDPELNGVYRETLVAKDSSGRGNDLHLVTLPAARKETIEKVGARAGVLPWLGTAAVVQPTYQATKQAQLIVVTALTTCGSERAASADQVMAPLRPAPAPAGLQPA